MTLYIVHVSTDIVVEAANDEEAREVATSVSKIDGTEFSYIVGKTVRCTADLPTGWDSYCIPWRRGSEEQTIGQLLGRFEVRP
jgi:hypothetical protein